MPHRSSTHTDREHHTLLRRAKLGSNAVPFRPPMSASCTVQFQCRDCGSPPSPQLCRVVVVGLAATPDIHRIPCHATCIHHKVRCVLARYGFLRRGLPPLLRTRTLGSSRSRLPSSSSKRTLCQAVSQFACRIQCVVASAPLEAVAVVMRVFRSPPSSAPTPPGCERVSETHQHRGIHGSE